MDGPRFLSGDGEMCALMRTKDWSGTAVGPVDTWPQSLRTVIQVMLGSRYAMWMAWGPQLVFFCNDAYTPTLGAKHPWALGNAANEVWKEIWPQIGPRIETVITTNRATWDEGLRLLLERHGYPEETYHTFSYSPLPDDTGAIGGMLCVVTEETVRVIAERRLLVLREFAERLTDARTTAQVFAALRDCLAGHREDLPFTLTGLVEPDGGGARLALATGVEDGAAGIAGDLARWPVSQVLADGEPIMLDDLADRFPDLPVGIWARAPRQAILLPILPQGQDRPTGVFVAGLNPFRPRDGEYTNFVRLLVSQLASGLANARAYEEERRRSEALAEIDRAKTAFFSNASHEFRTPLTLMLGPIEDLLARAGESGKIATQSAEIALIHRNALRLLKLVNTLLDFSRIEAGRLQARYEPVDLAAYTADLASTFRSAMDKAGLAFEIDCVAPATEVYVDRDMWEKIVLNLLSNAFKYTMQGGISVSMRPAEAGEAVELRVTDTGVGIPAAELAHLFERFHRVEGQKGRTQEGSGIGLALVQELVRLHGGKVHADSVQGEGSTFTVTIPTGSAHLAQDRIVARGDSGSSGTHAPAFIEEALRWLPGEAGYAGIENDLLGHEPIAAADGERSVVLIADDNTDMRDYLSRLLSRRYDVVAAPDGEQALTEMRRRRPGIVLSDVMMPRLDGFGLVQAMRADPALRDIPIVLLSARAGEEARIEGLESGADDYLVKPFSARELMARIAANLDLARVRQEALATMRSLNETLEERVATEIGKRLRAEEAFRQAQKMEAIGQLTGGVAHDFNNLLAVILGSLETLKRRAGAGALNASDPNFLRLLDAALQGGQRAATLTQRLLAFSRRQPLDPKPINPNKLVTGMASLLHSTMRENIQIETVLGGGIWWTSLDANQLESALLNLAVNARDAMPEGGLLTIETSNSHLDEGYAARHAEVMPGQYVAIAVSDTGEGMAPDVLARAFDPFFTTKGVGQGTGLGLSQVYGFVKQSGGHVKIYSEPGQGTTVRLYLPRLSAGAPEGDIAEPSHTIHAPNGELILIVEDDPHVRAYSIDMVSELGYRVIEAGNGAAALALLEMHPDVTLLFTDVGLPGGMNGRQLADEACRRYPHLKVLFTTGYARNAIIHHGRLDPGLALIVKPYTFPALSEKLHAVLSGQ